MPNNDDDDDTDISLHLVKLYAMDETLSHTESVCLKIKSFRNICVCFVSID